MVLDSMTTGCGLGTESTASLQKSRVLNQKCLLSKLFFINCPGLGHTAAQITSFRTPSPVLLWQSWQHQEQTPPCLPPDSHFFRLPSKTEGGLTKGSIIALSYMKRA